MTTTNTSIIELEPEEKKHRENIESGLDFILSHLSEPLFPRNISTKKSYNGQFKVESKQKILEAFVESNNADCRINAFSFSLFEFGLNWTPNLIFIDLDRNDFKSQGDVEKALEKTLLNIKQHLGSQGTAHCLTYRRRLPYNTACRLPCGTRICKRISRI